MSFTYITKVFIQQFNISVDHFQSQQLVVLLFQASAEIQAGIPATEASEGQLS